MSITICNPSRKTIQELYLVPKLLHMPIY